MGDMLTLIEKTQQSFDQKRADEIQKKIQSATLTLEDFLEQLQQVKKMGPLNQILDMIPGFSRLTKQLPQGLEDKQLKKVEAIVLSMTPEERRNPAIIDGRRRRRIALGSGTTPQDINQLLNQFNQMQKLMKQFGSGKGRNLLSTIGKGGGL
jgi:signal recognition particle subunit SRP54